MRLPLENWDLLTKHANPHDRAWTNGDVRELVVLAMELRAEVNALRDAINALNEACDDLIVSLEGENSDLKKRLDAMAGAVRRLEDDYPTIEETR
jgi:predicted nuclease with TOPRIM domain